MLILLLTLDNVSAAMTAATVPNTMRKSIFTTRPFSRVLWTVAYFNSGDGL